MKATTHRRNAERRAAEQPMTLTRLSRNLVSVRNDSHSDPEAHKYAVSVTDDGDVIRCTCLHHTERGADCKHMVAVEKSPASIADATGWYAKA